MVNDVEKREYADGSRTLVATIRDNGTVAFTTKMNDEAFIHAPMAAVSSAVLRQLADLADAAKAW